MSPYRLMYRLMYPDTLDPQLVAVLEGYGTFSWSLAVGSESLGLGLEVILPTLCPFTVDCNMTADW